MKYRYKFHPYDYALGENEKFYSDMESKGWRVVKRGSYLSKFAPVKPGKTRYRIEVVSPDFFMEDGCTMPPEQRAVYEDCGWEYVLGRDLFHLFRAPEDSEAPEFYANPDEQLPTIESLRKQRWWGWIGPVFVFIWNLFSRKFRAFGAMGTFYTWFKILVKQPAIFGVCVFSFLWLLYLSLRQMEVWHYDKTETVAVCGDMAAYIYYYGSPEPLTEALRERWAEYGKTEEGSK